MKNLIQILIILITVTFTSCGTTKIIETPGATVVQDKSFRSLSKWDYSVEFEDGTKRSATLTVKLKYGVDPKDIAHNAVERLFTSVKYQVVMIEVKPHSDMYGLVLNSNSKN